LGFQRGVFGWARQRIEADGFSSTALNGMTGVSVPEMTQGHSKELRVAELEIERIQRIWPPIRFNHNFDKDSNKIHTRS
jgi:hypothetical protein